MLRAPLAVVRGEQPDDLAANGDDRHRISLRGALMKRIGNFMRPLTMPKAAEPWSLTSLRDKLIKMGTKVLSHATTLRSKWLTSGYDRHSGRSYC